MPPGMQPTNIVRFNASNVGVMQMTASSKTLSEQNIVDYSSNFIRPRLFTIPGISLTAPYGGKQRQIMIDIDPQRRAAKSVSPNDVAQALQTSNVIVPAGVARLAKHADRLGLPPAVDSQVLNFGQSSTIDIQINDNNFDRADTLGQKLMQGLRRIPGARYQPALTLEEPAARRVGIRA